MKASKPLICAGCKRLRNRFSAALRDAKDNRIIGYLCTKKCTPKYRVKDRPDGMGWKAAFRQLLGKAGPVAVTL